MYAILFILIVRNVVSYVIRLKRYRECRVAWFYLLATSIVGLRAAEQLLVLVINHKTGSHSELNFDVWVVSYSCRQLENILGM